MAATHTIPVRLRSGSLERSSMEEPEVIDWDTLPEEVREMLTLAMRSPSVYRKRRTRKTMES